MNVFAVVLATDGDLVVSQNGVVRLSVPHLLYIHELERNDFSNPEY